MMALFAFASCSDDDDVEAYSGDEPVWSEAILPQGNHDYDKTIMALHKRYGFLPVYRFCTKDYSWNVTSHNDYSVDKTTGKITFGIVAAPADTNYVSDGLELMQQTVLQFLPDSIVKKTFPMLVFLADSIISASPKDIAGTEAVFDKELVYSGYDFFIFSGFNRKTSSMTASQRKSYRTAAMTMVFKRAVDNGVITYPSAFASVSTYDDNEHRSNYRQLGFVETIVPSAKYDLKTYLKAIVSMTTTQFQQQYANYPLVKKKYDIIVSYMKQQYGIDLQTIADAR